MSLPIEFKPKKFSLIRLGREMMAVTLSDLTPLKAPRA